MALEEEREVGEEKEVSEEILEERIYVIPLAKKFIYTPRQKRAEKAVRVLKEFVERHMKPEKIIINPEVNEKIWERGIQSPPRKIRVRVTKDKEGVVKVFLAER
ncbi:MAG: 50S ribosomal protein L31e [Candidatus Baldrarchaeia archaeon]|nr:50S ribosomal protein L31e [Candidatus Baldrarchaeota archaeon]